MHNFLPIAAVMEKWDFCDNVENSIGTQINRQKSARNLRVEKINKSLPEGVFSLKGQVSTCNLTSCDCRDFNFAGRSPRKTFKPCMHIYRLAKELGLCELVHLDFAAREAQEMARLSAIEEIEAQKLRAMSKVPNLWGGWANEIHGIYFQRDRLMRGQEIIGDEREEITPLNVAGLFGVRGYRVSLQECECPDYFQRRLPCKHIYAVALKDGDAAWVNAT